MGLKHWFSVGCTLQLPRELLTFPVSLPYPCSSVTQAFPLLVLLSGSNVQLGLKTNALGHQSH